MSDLVQATNARVGATIRAQRQKRDWSQDALASRMRSLGMSSWRQTTVAKVEASTNPRPLTLQEAVALTFALGLPRMDFLFGSDSRVADALLQNYVDEQHKAVVKLQREVREVLASDDPQIAAQLDASMAETLTGIDEWYAGERARIAASQDAAQQGIEGLDSQRAVARDLLDELDGGSK